MLEATAQADNPAIRQAVAQMATAASNVSRVFFPKNLIISGLFVKNAQIWQAFCDDFMQQNTNFGQTVQSLSVNQVSRTELHWSLAGRNVFWVGGVESFKIEDLLDLYGFSIDMSERMRQDRLAREL